MTEYDDAGAKANHVTILATSWTLFSVAFLFFVARLLIRWRISKRLYWDDGWAFFALVLLFIHAIVLNVMLRSIYYAIKMQKISASIKRETNVLEMVFEFLKFQFAETFIFWTCLWAVKASFLAFFKRLTTNVRFHYAAWWVIVVITALAYIGCVITYPISCSDFSSCKCPSDISGLS